MECELLFEGTGFSYALQSCQGEREPCFPAALYQPCRDENIPGVLLPPLPPLSPEVKSSATRQPAAQRRSSITLTVSSQALPWISLTRHAPPPTSPSPGCAPPSPVLCPSLTPSSSSSSSLSPLSSAAASLPDCFQSFLREEALDFFCSQCHKQISRLEDLSTRLNFLEMTR